MKSLILILTLLTGCATNETLTRKTLNSSNLVKTPQGTLKLATQAKESKLPNGALIKERESVVEADLPIPSLRREFIEPLKGAQIQKKLQNRKATESGASLDEKSVIEISPEKPQEGSGIKILWERLLSYYFVIAVLAAICVFLYRNRKDLNFKLKNPFDTKD